MIWYRICWSHFCQTCWNLLAFDGLFADRQWLIFFLFFKIIQINWNYLFAYRTVKLKIFTTNKWTLKHKWLIFFDLFILFIFYAMQTLLWFNELSFFNLWLNTINFKKRIRSRCQNALFWRFIEFLFLKAALLMLNHSLFPHSQSTCLTSESKTIFLLNRNESIKSTSTFHLMSS